MLVYNTFRPKTRDRKGNTFWSCLSRLLCCPERTRRLLHFQEQIFASDGRKFGSTLITAAAKLSLYIKLHPTIAGSEAGAF